MVVKKKKKNLLQEKVTGDWIWHIWYGIMMVWTHLCISGDISFLPEGKHWLSLHRYSNMTPAVVAQEENIQQNVHHANVVIKYWSLLSTNSNTQMRNVTKQVVRQWQFLWWKSKRPHYQYLACCSQRQNLNMNHTGWLERTCECM